MTLIEKFACVKKDIRWQMLNERLVPFYIDVHGLSALYEAPLFTQPNDGLKHHREYCEERKYED